MKLTFSTGRRTNVPSQRNAWFDWYNTCVSHGGVLELHCFLRVAELGSRGQLLFERNDWLDSGYLLCVSLGTLHTNVKGRLGVLKLADASVAFRAEFTKKFAHFLVEHHCWQFVVRRQGVSEEFLGASMAHSCELSRARGCQGRQCKSCSYMFCCDFGVSRSRIFYWCQGLKPFQVSSSLLPKQLDEQVSTLHFPALGAVLTVFAEEHAGCIGVKLGSLATSTACIIRHCCGAGKPCDCSALPLNVIAVHA